MTRAHTGLVLLALAAACAPPSQPVYEPGVPFYLALAPASAGDPPEVPVADATFDVGPTHVTGPVLWDTGSALTTLLSLSQPNQEIDGAVLHVYDDGDPTMPIERLLFPPETFMEIDDCKPSPPGTPCQPWSPWTGVLGGDLLADFTIHLDYCLTAASCVSGAPVPSVQVSLSPYDSTPDNGFPCGAVFHYILAGGGVFPNPDPSRGDTPYPATRVLLDACLDPDPLSKLLSAGTQATPSGVDTTLLLDTGSPALVLASSVADLLPAGDSGAGGATQVALPDGPLAGTAGALDRIALVQRDVFDTPADARGPCMEVYCTRVHELRAAYAGSPSMLSQLPALCPDETSFPQGEQAPAADAYVVLGRVAGGSPANRVPYVRVPDEAPVLQALRNEVLPNGQRVDGFLGTTILERLHLEIDYPDSRLIATCVDPRGTGTTCRVQVGHPPNTSLPCCPAAANPPGIPAYQCGAPP